MSTSNAIPSSEQTAWIEGSKPEAALLGTAFAERASTLAQVAAGEAQQRALLAAAPDSQGDS
jgi:hypothetical protein